MVRIPLFGALVCAAVLSAPAIAQNVGATFNATVDGYIEVPYAPAVVPQSGITVEAWITYDDATLPSGWRYPTVFRQGLSVGGSEDYFLRVNADNSGLRVLRWKIVTQSGTAYQVNWNFAAGQLLNWTHVACTYDGQTSAMYINGSLVGSVVTNGSPLRDLNNEVFRIGKGSDVATPIEVWNGSIDEARLWPFARTQAEIAATMNYALASVPGRVSTWNLDGHSLDTSGGLHGTASGSVSWTANPLTLTMLPAPSAFAVGTSTPGCLGDLAATLTSLPQPGNAAFGTACTRAPANATGFLAMGFGTAAAPLHVAGIDFWLDPLMNFVVLTSANGLGTARATVALPGWITPGFSLAFQYGFLDVCGPQGFTASNALLCVTQ